MCGSHDSHGIARAFFSAQSSRGVRFMRDAAGANFELRPQRWLPGNSEPPEESSNGLQYREQSCRFPPFSGMEAQEAVYPRRDPRFMRLSDQSIRIPAQGARDILRLPPV